MKAPEKLYIGRRNYGPLIGGWKLQPFTSQEIESIEYIRKEALLEWLEHAKTVYNIRGANTFELLTLQMVIEYINSM